MSNPIENLGDYNKVRIELQDAGGNMDVLYKKIGDTAVAEVTPKLLLTGGAIVVGLYGVVQISKKGVRFMKDRRQKLKNEPALKKEFARAVEDETRKSVNEEVADGMTDLNTDE